MLSIPLTRRLATASKSSVILLLLVVVLVPEILSESKIAKSVQQRKWGSEKTTLGRFKCTGKE